MGGGLKQEAKMQRNKRQGGGAGVRKVSVKMALALDASHAIC